MIQAYTGMIGEVISEVVLSAVERTEFGLLPLTPHGPVEFGRSPTRFLTKFSMLSRLKERGMGAET
jgi:hypothetical protein